MKVLMHLSDADGGGLSSSFWRQNQLVIYETMGVKGYQKGCLHSATLSFEILVNYIHILQWRRVTNSGMQSHTEHTMFVGD
jgi:hypothetical protein